MNIDQELQEAREAARSAAWAADSTYWEAAYSAAWAADPADSAAISAHSAARSVEWAVDSAANKQEEINQQINLILEVL